MFNKYIKAKILSPEQAKKLELPIFSFGSGRSFIIAASGQIGKTEAERVSIHHPETGEEHILFDKGKIFEFKGFKNQKKMSNSKIEQINKLRIQ